MLLYVICCVQDVEAVLAGAEEAILAAQRAAGGGVSMQDDGGGSGDVGGDAQLHLPQLANVLPDRAELQLQELRKFQVWAGQTGARGGAVQGMGGGQHGACLGMRLDC